jgi:hypothetical protein
MSNLKQNELRQFSISELSHQIVELRRRFVESVLGPTSEELAVPQMSDSTLGSSCEAYQPR